MILSIMAEGANPASDSREWAKNCENPPEIFAGTIQGFLLGSKVAT